MFLCLPGNVFSVISQEFHMKTVCLLFVLCLCLSQHGFLYLLASRGGI